MHHFKLAMIHKMAVRFDPKYYGVCPMPILRI